MNTVPMISVESNAFLTDWDITDGVLTVRGNGPLPTYDKMKDIPWYDRRDEVTSLVLGGNITDIGDMLFTGMTNLETIAFPDTVTSIGWQTFSDCSSLKELDLPDSLTSIGNGSFLKCTSLEAVSLPDSLESIDVWAFGYCENLKNVVLPENLSSIGSYTFYNCKSITDITLPQKIDSLGEGLFQGCSSLKNYSAKGKIESVRGNVFVGTPWLNEQPGIVTYDGKWVLAYNGTDKDVTIPDGATEICDYAFIYNDNISKVTLPESLKTIGRQAFLYSTLSEIQMPSVEVIGEGAFSDTLLTSIKFPDSIIELESYTLQNCEELSDVDFGSALTNIPKGIFTGCTALKNVTIPENIRDIEAMAFYRCSALESVTFEGRSLDTLGNSAFSNCTSLKQIDIPNGIKTIEESTFYGCKALEAVTIPSSAEAIKTNAFYNCTELKSVTVPESVTSIGKQALGYSYFTDRGYAIIDGFVMYGYEGSKAQEYAEENNIDFIALSDTSIVGDVNNDGVFNIADAVLLQKWLLAVPDTQLDNWKAADFCEDDKLDAFDFCLMKRALIEQSQKSFVIPDGYIAVFHGGADDLEAETYIYKIDNGAANYGFEYINVTRSSFNIDHTEQVTLTGQGELMWTDEVFMIAEANNAYDYVTIPNDDKIYTIEEFMEIFLMD